MARARAIALHRGVQQGVLQARQKRSASTTPFILHPKFKKPITLHHHPPLPLSHIKLAQKGCRVSVNPFDVRIGLTDKSWERNTNHRHRQRQSFVCNLKAEFWQPECHRNLACGGRGEVGDKAEQEHSHIYTFKHTHTHKFINCSKLGPGTGPPILV